MSGPDVAIAVHDGRIDATVTGALSEHTVPRLRDELIKCGTADADVLAVHLDGLTVERERLLTVFSVVGRQLAEWPGTLLVLVCGRPDLRDALARTVINRFVPVVDDVARIPDVTEVPDRRRMWRQLPHDANAAFAARRFVRDTCAQWEVEAFTDFAVTIVGELVENAIRHTLSGPRIRLELRKGMFTVAVTDESPARPVLLERPTEHHRGLGLRIVGELARVWGAAPTPSGGKVVWAVLTEMSLRPRRVRRG